MTAREQELEAALTAVVEHLEVGPDARAVGGLRKWAEMNRDAPIARVRDGARIALQVLEVLGR